MKVFLDEGVPEPLERLLSDHEVSSVGSLGLKGTKNGKLLAIVENLPADAFITADKSMQKQQNLLGRPFATLLLSTNSWPLIRDHIADIRQVLETAPRAEVTPVDCGVFVPRRFRKPQP